MSEAQSKVDEAVGRVRSRGNSIVAYFDGRAHHLEKGLPPFMEGQGARLARIAVSTILSRPELQRCDQSSLFRCVMQAAELGLSVDGVTGGAWVVPYGNKAQLQLGYRGLIELIYRSGKFDRVIADVVHEHDMFDFEEGTSPFLVHKRDLKTELASGRGDMIAAYAVAHPVGGGPATFKVLSKADVYKRRDSSKTAKQSSSPWQTHEAAMWSKSAVRELAKYLPASANRHSDVQRAALVDEARDEGRKVQDDVIDMEDGNDS